MAGVEENKDPLCPTCSRPLPSGELLEENPRFRCGDCRIRRPEIDRARTILNFSGPVREAIHLFKYHGYWRLGRRMIASFPEAVKEASSGADLVLPVPLDRARLRNRGFNQAVVLAREVSTLLGVPMYLDVLLRTRSGRPQAGLKGRERRRNVRGCFSLKRPDKIKGCSVLVVDDVLTTGATANECAKILKVGGAREVQLLALAGARPEVTK